MHWEGHELALPRPPKGTCWEAVFSTEADQELIKDKPNNQDEELLRNVPPRSIAVYISVPVKEQAMEKGRKNVDMTTEELSMRPILRRLKRMNRLYAWIAI